MLGVMLLYVGAVLVVNGIWLIGQARVAEIAPDPSRVDVDTGATEAARPAPRTSLRETHPSFIQGREVTVINIFTGFVGIVIAVTQLVQGNAHNDLSLIRGGGFILLFAFTYLWVAFNGWLNAGGHGFGWYCLFVAITAVAAGAYTFKDGVGNTANAWLGIDWFVWAVLWFLFFLLLALDRPIGKITGAASIAVGIGTSWVFGFLLMQGTVKF